jgi:enoyl-CoA hydratase/carnithine racemase
MSGEAPSPSGERVVLEMSGGIAEVRLDRPDKLNALDSAMFAALVETGERLRRTPGVRVVVLHGAGRGFCAGLDMGHFATMASGAKRDLSDLTARTHGLANSFQHAVYVWRDLPVPVIAAIHGVAFGGGFQIALGADIRYVAPDAKLSILEIKWGLVPDMAGIALMRELARADVIRELALTGRVFSGEQALAYGFATRACPEPLAAARETAREIASRSPDAVRALKRLLNRASDDDVAAILLAESREQGALIGSPNQIEAVKAGLENRPARYVDP